MEQLFNNMSTQNIEDNHLVPIYGKREISLLKGEGVYVFDEEGKKYLDCVNGLGAVILGYSNKAFQDAMQEQVGMLMSTHSSFYSKERALFLEALHGILPEELSHSFISNTGTESVEAALKFARLITGKPGVISAKRAYHGRTFGALSASGTSKYKDPFEPLLSHMRQVAYNNITAIEEAYSDEIGAIILEPIQGESGVYVPDTEYLKSVKSFCEEKGIICIFDEVQSAYRTGDWLAATRYGVIPDIVCLSKAIGNGMPIAVTVTTENIAEQVPKGSHGTTFGSNPLACRAGRIVIEQIQQQHLLSKTQKVGEYFKERLQAINSSIIRDIRSSGFFIGVELKKKSGVYVKKMQQDHNILILTTGTVLRFLPSMIFEKKHVDEVIHALEKVLHDV